MRPARCATPAGSRDGAGVIPRIDPTRVILPTTTLSGDGTDYLIRDEALHWPLMPAWGVDGPDASLFIGPRGANRLRIPLGGLGRDGQGNLYQLVRSTTTAIAQYDCVVGQQPPPASGSLWDVQPVTHDLLMGNATRWLGVVQAAFPATEAYGWAQVSGYGRVNVLNGCVIDATLHTSDTPGSLDDGSAGQTSVHGVGLAAAATADEDVPCFFVWPTGHSR